MLKSKLYGPLANLVRRFAHPPAKMYIGFPNSRLDGPLAGLVHRLAILLLKLYICFCQINTATLHTNFPGNLPTRFLCLKTGWMAPWHAWSAGWSTSYPSAKTVYSTFFHSKHCYMAYQLFWQHDNTLFTLKKGWMAPWHTLSAGWLISLLKCTYVFQTVAEWRTWSVGWISVS
jgi:hypothetical protein